MDPDLGIRPAGKHALNIMTRHHRMQSLACVPAPHAVVATCVTNTCTSAATAPAPAAWVVHEFPEVHVCVAFQYSEGTSAGPHVIGLYASQFVFAFSLLHHTLVS